MSKARGCLPQSTDGPAGSKPFRLDPGAQTAVQCDSWLGLPKRVGTGFAASRNRGRSSASSGSRRASFGFAFWYLMRSDRALGDFPISGQHQRPSYTVSPLRRAGSGVASSFRHVRIPARRGVSARTARRRSLRRRERWDVRTQFRAILTALEPWRSAIGAATASAVISAPAVDSLALGA